MVTHNKQLMISMLRSSLIVVSIIEGIERIKDHNCRDHASHMKKHNNETSPTDINTANFKIIDVNFSNNKKKQKIS